MAGSLGGTNHLSFAKLNHPNYYLQLLAGLFIWQTFFLCVFAFICILILSCSGIPIQLAEIKNTETVLFPPSTKGTTVSVSQSLIMTS